MTNKHQGWQPPRGCEYCAEHVAIYGAWKCPQCKAEWPDNGLKAPPEQEGGL